MRIKYATAKDMQEIISLINELELDYITPEHISFDIANKKLIIAEHRGLILGFFSLWPERDYNYTAIKRFVVPNRSWQSGFERAFIIKSLLDYGESKVKGAIGATPFSGNPMERILRSRGYIFRYNFGEYQFYAKEI